MTSDTVATPDRRWYLGLASHLKDAYLRYSFTKGTVQEVDFLVDVLRIKPGAMVLDVGCGPGRHLVELAARDVTAVGIDISRDFLSVASALARDRTVNVHLAAMDALDIGFKKRFDAVISLCEGGFGLGLDDLRILRGMAGSVRSEGSIAVACPNAAFVETHLAASGTFDKGSMLYEETVDSVIGEKGTVKAFTMWNSCYTAGSLADLATSAGVEVQAVYGISPGGYRRSEPTSDHPELLMVGRVVSRPGS